MASGADANSLRVAVCGAGIIGCSTAYYLAKAGVRPVVIEQEEPAAAASGKAGGFLALDWNDHGATGPLSRVSYALHRQLAADLKEEVGADVGYREVETLSVQVSQRPRPKAALKKSAAELPDWVDGSIAASESIGTTQTTAQVHPHHLTSALLEAARKLGATYTRGTVEGIVTAEGDGQKLAGVVVGGVVMPFDVVVLAMGPWSGTAQRWLPKGCIPSFSGVKAHSIVLRPAEATTAHCFFTSYRTAEGKNKEPEIYPRPDGTVYVCGESDSVPVPGCSAEVVVREGATEALQQVASSFASCLAKAPVEASQACFLPYTDDGVPAIGAVPGVQGLYIAAGHSCWGILQGPATGLAMAELITRGASTSVNLAPFNPARFFRRR